jgi:hypothetical protein
MRDHHLGAHHGGAAEGAAPAGRRRRASLSRHLLAAPLAVLLCGSLAATSARADVPAAGDGSGSGARHAPYGPAVHPSLFRNLVSYYDFEHPVRDNPAAERDLGFSRTNIGLVNGGSSMRVRDGAYPGSAFSIQTKQVEPTIAGNDDWKAGTYSATGVPSMHAFNGMRQASIMGWFKMTGPNPNLNSNTPDPDDRYNAVGLAGVLSGNSEGHDVRALLEVINVSGRLRVVALGRRLDGGSSQTFAADEDWQSVLPPDTWVFLAATFDYDTGAMSLYKNGRPLPGSYTLPGDPWEVSGAPEPDFASATDPRGIKIGGSFPQNTREANPCNCRMDGLMFLNRAVSPAEVHAQYRRATTRRD